MLAFNLPLSNTENQWKDQINFDFALNQSANRLKDNPYIQLVEKQARRIEAQQDNFTYTLNYEDYLLELETNKKISEKFNVLKEYKSELHAQHGIVFNNLYTITNMPISRFGGMLLAKGLCDEYMSILKNSFQPENLATVMCRTLISVDYRGYVYDCDFNQMLGLHLLEHGDLRLHILDLVDRNVIGNQIKVGQHCFGCTAGQGSSCSGAMKN